MRVAYICLDQGVPIFGAKGCSVHAQEIMRTLLRRGAAIDLFAASPGGSPPADLADVTVHPLPVEVHDDPAERELASIALNEPLYRLLQRAGRFDLIYERYSLWSTAAIKLAAATGTPSVLEINAPLIDEQQRHRVLVHRRQAEVIARRTFETASCICAVSDEVALWAGRHGADGEKTIVVPNGVCLQRFSPDVPPADADLADKFTVGFVGSLKPWHGVEQLLEAFSTLHARHCDAHLLIVGDGPQRKALARRRKGLPTPVRKSIHMVGGVPPDEVPAWLTSMTVAVAPYPKMPNFYFSPLKLYEYMAAGRAVAASDVGQMQSVIEHGVSGVCYPAGDVLALTRQLIRLREDGDLAAALGRHARQCAQRHTWDSVVDRIHEAVLPSESLTY